MSVAPPRARNANGTLSPSASVVSSPDRSKSLLSSSNLNSRSFQNLTTSALSGVFGSQVSLAELAGDTVSSRTRNRNPGALNDDDILDEETKKSLVSGHGSMSVPSKQQRTPKQHASLPSLSDTGFVRLSFPTLVVRLIALFVFGVGYGELARNLHDNHQVTNETLNIAISQNSAIFSLAWGAQGILLGFLLPLFDWLFPTEASKRAASGKGGTDWSSIIRAIAAFLGVAYGVRKLPWDSSMQVAALWGLVNPFLWYLLDATRNGFILSSLVAIVGTCVFAIVFPSNLPKAELSPMYITVTVWVASVYFICSICFGNLGRRMLSFGAKAK